MNRKDAEAQIVGKAQSDPAQEVFVVLPVPTADAPLDDRELDAVSGGAASRPTYDKKLHGGWSSTW